MDIDKDCTKKVVNKFIIEVDMEEVINHKEVIIHKEDKEEEYNIDKEVGNIKVIKQEEAFINKLFREVI